MSKSRHDPGDMIIVPFMENKVLRNVSPSILPFPQNSDFENKVLDKKYQEKNGTSFHVCVCLYLYRFDCVLSVCIYLYVLSVLFAFF